MQYKVVDSSSPQDLQSAVNIALQMGWKINGSLQVIQGYHSTRYIQALIKD